MGTAIEVCHSYATLKQSFLEPEQWDLTPKNLDPFLVKCDKGDRRPIVRPERSSSEEYLEFQTLAGSRKGSRLG